MAGTILTTVREPNLHRMAGSFRRPDPWSFAPTVTTIQAVRACLCPMVDTAAAVSWVGRHPTHILIVQPSFATSWRTRGEPPMAGGARRPSRCRRELGRGRASHRRRHDARDQQPHRQRQQEPDHRRGQITAKAVKLTTGCNVGRRYLPRAIHHRAGSVLRRAQPETPAALGSKHT